MKILIAHNFYDERQPSGENDLVALETDLLRSAGHEVEILEMRSSHITSDPRKLLSAPIGPVLSPVGWSATRGALRTFQPDIVHLHNPFPLISPYMIRQATAAGVPVVQSVHNYRHECANGLLFREGQVCTECPDSGSPMPSIRHGCYRNSRIQSVPMAVSTIVHKSTWNQVSRFFVLTDFMVDRFRARGIAADKIFIKPNHSPDPGPTCPPPTRDVFFAGRLTEEKGVRLLIEAWLAGPDRSPRKLRLAGSGPLEAYVLARAGQNKSIEVLGQLNAEEVATETRRCGVVAVPSTCFEGFPTTVVEAMAHARPCIVTNVGSAGTVVDSTFGWVTPATSAGIAEALAESAAADLSDMGSTGRQLYDRCHSAAAVTAALEGHYEELLH